jgi:hypothetical protein
MLATAIAGREANYSRNTAAPGTIGTSWMSTSAGLQ